MRIVLDTRYGLLMVHRYIGFVFVNYVGGIHISLGFITLMIYK